MICSIDVGLHALQILIFHTSITYVLCSFLRLDLAISVAIDSAEKFSETALPSFRGRALSVRGGGVANKKYG